MNDRMHDSADAHCRDLLPWYAANLLDEEERDVVARHLATCASCQHELAHWQAIGAATQRTLQHVKPNETDAASWRQLQSALSSEQSLNGKHATTRGDSYMEFENQSSYITTTTPHNPARRPILTLAAVALVVILGIASFALFASHTPSSSRLSPIGATGGTATSTTTNGAIPPVYLTPGTLVTPAPNTTVPITQVKTSTNATNNSGQLQISGQTALFHIDDTINVSFKVQGAKANDVISVKWYLNGTDLTPSLKQTLADCCSKAMADDKTSSIIFTLMSPKPGFGKAEIYYNTTLADTVLFDVVTPAQSATLTPTSH